MLRPEEYRQLLAAMIRAAGAELGEKAEEIVGEMDRISGFQIVLDFPQETAIPTIEIRRTHVNIEALEVYRAWHMEKRK